jgi:tRNA modification GTPase
MKNNLSAYNTGDCIAALATPWGASALAVIRTSGPGCAELLAPAFNPGERLLSAPGGSMIHGILLDPDTAQTIDDVVLGIFRAPGGYTGEEGVEIYCHGSLPGIRRILALLGRLGFRGAQPGEFTFRAFFNGKLDLTQAEAVHEIITAETDKAQSLALHRLAGGVAARINEAKALLMEVLGEIEIRLDYPEEDAPDGPLSPGPLFRAEEILRRLLDTCREGRLYQEGVRVALAGRTNAGKSSLFNFFLREDRSIVSEHPGTTRDYIEALLSVGGIPVRLYDTAGLRDSADPVESEGVRRSRLLLDSAALVIYLIDATEGISPEDEGNIRRLADRALVVRNKIDLIRPGKSLREDSRIPAISALTGEGLPELLEALEKKLLLRAGGQTGDETIIDSQRQSGLLAQSLAALERFRSRIDRFPLDIVAEDIQEALSALGQITGEVTTEDMLAHMFSRFCVGK